jgi:hypothetical protein
MLNTFVETSTEKGGAFRCIKEERCAQIPPPVFSSHDTIDDNTKCAKVRHGHVQIRSDIHFLPSQPTETL